MSFTTKLCFLILIFQFSNTIASCWPTAPSATSAHFILAMGANTGVLQKANHDAQSFADAISEHFEINKRYVCVLKNVKRWQFKNALKRLQKLVRTQDKVFIYFSGHGTTMKDHDPDETDCLDEAFVTYSEPFVRDDEFVAWVNALKTNHVITFIDSCFASGMLRGEKGCPKGAKSKFWPWSNPKDEEEKLPSRFCPPKKFKTLKGTLYAAAKEHQLAWEYLQGSIFTNTFLRNLKLYPNTNLDKLFDITAKQVIEKTKDSACKQEPQRWPKIEAIPKL